MTDIAAISAFISSIKNATDIARVIKDSGTSLEKAEIKLKIAELIESLAEAKIQVSEIKEVIQEKDQRIAELEKAFELKAKLLRKGDAYYEGSEKAEPVGSPYCSHCWEVNHSTIHLTHIIQGPLDWICPSCKNTYSRKRVHVLSAISQQDLLNNKLNLFFGATAMFIATTGKKATIKGPVNKTGCVSNKE